LFASTHVQTNSRARPASAICAELVEVEHGPVAAVEAERQVELAGDCGAVDGVRCGTHD
jgi:hypothetical protein